MGIGVDRFSAQEDGDIPHPPVEMHSGLRCKIKGAVVRGLGPLLWPGHLGKTPMPRPNSSARGLPSFSSQSAPCSLLWLRGKAMGDCGYHGASNILGSPFPAPPGA
jgi:hypothetical protein